MLFRSLTSYRELRDLELVADAAVPTEAIQSGERWLKAALIEEVRAYQQRRAMLSRHSEIGNANKAFLYLLAMGMLRSAKNRPGVKDGEQVSKVVSEAAEMADEDRLIIYDIQLDKMSDAQKRELIVHLGAELHAGQWRSTPHFRRAAMHVIQREYATLRKNQKTDATTTRLIAQLGRRAEALLG